MFSSQIYQKIGKKKEEFIEVGKAIELKRFSSERVFDVKEEMYFCFKV
jgi:hypothetical protein